MHKRTGRWLLLGVSFVTLIFAFFATRIEFNYDVDSFFPVGDPDLEFYEKFTENFPSDIDYLLVAIEHRPAIYDSIFLSQISEFTKRLDTIPQVERVTSVLNLGVPIISPLGPIQVPYINTDKPDMYAANKNRISSSPIAYKNLVSEDHDAMAILIKHTDYIKKAGADSLMYALNTILSDYNFDDIHIAGKANAQQVYINKTKYELLVFISASVVLVIILLWVFYRTWWGIIIPLIVVLMAMLWTFGFMGMVGKKIDILMVLLPTILFVVGMSDVVHILSKYLEELRNGRNKIAALWTTVREIGLATFLTSLTTAVGFFTLITARIIPIREFGIYTGLGVFFAYIVAFTFLPATLLFQPKPKVALNDLARRRWQNLLSRSFVWVINHKLIILAGTIILLVLAGIGISQVKINTYLVEGLPKNDPLKRDFLFFDANFGGSRPIEMALELETDTVSFFDHSILLAVDSIENKIRQLYGAGNLFSPATAAKVINQATHGGQPSYYQIPSPSEIPTIKKYASFLSESKAWTSVVSPDGHWARVTGKMPDMGSYKALQKNDTLFLYIDEVTQGIPLKATLTGTSLLLDNNNLYLTRGMISSLSIAFLVIAIITAIMFKSLRMILIVLIPNMIPLVLVAGIMGFGNIPLQLATSIIFTIAFGIAVDDTIHFTSKLRIELGKGKSFVYALKRTYLSTGKALIVTTIILSGGFLTLMLSNFSGTVFTGLLVSVTLLLAVISDLTLMPVLLILFFKWRK